MTTYFKGKEWPTAYADLPPEFREFAATLCAVLPFDVPDPVRATLQLIEQFNQKLTTFGLDAQAIAHQIAEWPTAIRYEWQISALIEAATWSTYLPRALSVNDGRQVCEFIKWAADERLRTGGSLATQSDRKKLYCTLIDIIDAGDYHISQT
jgi:hypothetical protein